jgi:hypothetical protein
VVAESRSEIVSLREKEEWQSMISEALFSLFRQAYQPTAIEIVAVKTPGNNSELPSSTTWPQRIQSKQVISRDYNKLQQAAQTGSGPGGRRFKSSLPDNVFNHLKVCNALKVDSWVLAQGV